MATWKCEMCGGQFKRDKAGSRAIRFCSQKCYHAWRASTGCSIGQFRKGQAPWNKGLKGYCPSPETCFHKGMAPVNKTWVGTVRIRTQWKRGDRRAWIKVREPREWRELAKVVWESVWGTIPKGGVIHHADGNPLNDNPVNLVLLSRGQHMDVHRNQFRKATA